MLTERKLVFKSLYGSMILLRNDLISFTLKIISKSYKTKTISILEMENPNKMKANATKVCVYTVHTNKYTEPFSNQPTRTSIRDRHENSHAQADEKILEIKNFLL